MIQEMLSTVSQRDRSGKVGLVYNLKLGSSYLSMSRLCDQSKLRTVYLLLNPWTRFVAIICTIQCSTEFLDTTRFLDSNEVTPFVEISSVSLLLEKCYLYILNTILLMYTSQGLNCC